MKLLSMTDFVLEQYAKKIIGYDEFCIYVLNYAQFLKQPLELWMFDENDEKCLFNGFDVEKANILIKCFSNIEALSRLNKKLQLTETAIKQLGL